MALFEEPGCEHRTVAEVVVSRDTLRRINRDGIRGAEEAAERLATALIPVLYEAARGRLPPAGGRARPRRERVEVLAARQEAKAAQLQALKTAYPRNPTGPDPGGGAELESEWG